MRLDSHTPAAHHFQTFLYILQGDMRLVLVGGIKPRTGIFHDDLGDGISASTIRVSCSYEDAKRVGVGVNAMLDGILNDGLQCQWRQTELCKGCIVFHKKHLFIPDLFYGQIGAGVFQLRGKGNEVSAGDSIEVLRDIRTGKRKPGFLYAKCQNRDV